MFEIAFKSIRPSAMWSRQEVETGEISGCLGPSSEDGRGNQCRGGLRANAARPSSRLLAEGRGRGTRGLQSTDYRPR